MQPPNLILLTQWLNQSFHTRSSWQKKGPTPKFHSNSKITKGLEILSKILEHNRRVNLVQTPQCDRVLIRACLLQMLKKVKLNLKLKRLITVTHTENLQSYTDNDTKLKRLFRIGFQCHLLEFLIEMIVQGL